MLTKEDILTFRNAIQSFLLNQQHLFNRIGVESKSHNLNLVESYINEIFNLLNDLEQEVNSHERDYSVINNTASTLYEERDHRIGFKPDDMKLKETYNRNVNYTRDNLIDKIRIMVITTGKILEDEGYKDTRIVVNNNYISLSQILDKILRYAEMLMPRQINTSSVVFTSSEDTKDKLSVIQEYEESDLNLESLQDISFISKLKGETVMAITGKDDLLKISSLEKKIAACEYAIASLEGDTFDKTKELLMNLVTRYKNEMKFARMRFNRSDFNYIKKSLIQDKKQKEREQKIFSYASTYAMYLDAIDANDEDKMTECEGYLESYQMTDNEMLDARVEGTNMYYENKKASEAIK